MPQLLPPFFFDRGEYEPYVGYNRVILKRQFAAFYSLVDCEFFRQTERVAETMFSKIFGERISTKTSKYYF